MNFAYWKCLGTTVTHPQSGTLHKVTTSSGVSMSTKTVWQQFHCMGFHGWTAPVGGTVLMSIRCTTIAAYIPSICHSDKYQYQCDLWAFLKRQIRSLLEVFRCRVCTISDSFWVWSESVGTTGIYHHSCDCKLKHLHPEKILNSYTFTGTNALCSRWYDSRRPDTHSESLPFFKFYIPVIIEMFQYICASFRVGSSLHVHRGDVISFKWKGWLEGSLKRRLIFSYKTLRQSWGSERQVKCWGGKR